MAVHDMSSRDSDHATSETIKLLANRVSVRRYDDKPVDPKLIDAILAAAFRAPTSSNIQAYSVIVVRDTQVKAELSVATGNQAYVASAPVFLAFCADLTRIEHAARMQDKVFDVANLETCLVSSIDASLVGMSASLAAESLGLSSVMIGAVRNNALETARILGLPNRVFCVFGMCIGWPAEAPPQKPRMDRSQMVHYDQYGQLSDERAPQHALGDYDRALSDHYEAINKPTTSDSWTHNIARKFDPPLRDDLRRELKELGFDFR